MTPCEGPPPSATRYLDPRPRHPRDPQAQYCRDCAADLFDIGDEDADHA